MSIHFSPRATRPSPIRRFPCMPLAALLVPVALQAQTPVFVNELHYDNSGTDVGEAIEVAGPAGTSLAGWSVVLYNGSGGASYNALDLTETLADQCGGLGTEVLTLPTNGLQNGAPDGLALVDAGGQVVEFLSYEGSFTASDGPASGMTSVDIGVSESSSTSTGQSLQRTGSGRFGEDFTWTGPVAASFGNCNAGQVFSGGDGGPLALLLSEIAVTPTGAEFIEIHNPNGVVVDLGNVYLTDATFSQDGVFYYNLVTGDISQTGGGGFGDFTARFPDAASIPAGAYRTVALAGSEDFMAAYGIAPDFELFEDGSAADGIPDMREALPGSINGQGGLANSGEVVILFTWDAAGDLVADLDYAPWGDKDEAVDKTGISRDGPDADADASTYLPDTAIADQEVLAAGGHAAGNSFQRDDPAEGSEVGTGGNAVDGADETSENLSATWCEAAATPGQATVCDPPQPLTCGDPATPIHQVQGSGAATPLAEGSVVDIEAVVVGDFANQQPAELGGLFLQEEDADADADPLTSEGIFVAGDSFDVAPGDRVRVRGAVDEFFGLTRIENVTGAVVCASGLAVTPVALTLPLADTSDLEAFEGMSVVLPQTLTVTDQFELVRFGEFTLSSGRLLQPTQIVLPGATAVDQQALNDLNRMIVDDGRNGSNAQPFVVGRDDTSPLDAGNPVRNGYQVTGLAGVMNFTFGDYKIEPTTGLVFDEAANPRRAGPELPATPLRVASLNVLNYFSTIDTGAAVCGPPGNLQGCRGADSSAELQRQTDKLVSTIVAMDSDIIGLVELENNASASLQSLVDALNAAGSPGDWAFIDTGTIGTDVIKVGLIYRPAVVGPVGSFAILDAGVDPRFDDSLNRPSLAQSFEHLATGEVLTVDVNHFKSKGCGGAGGDDADQGDGQACFNATRSDAAAALADWLATDPTASGDPDFVILGDLNAYRLEDPIRALVDRGLVDLGAMFETAERAYTFTFFGQAGALDYAVASPSLALKVLDATHWHANSDEPGAFDYNLEDLPGGLARPAGFFAPDAFRGADHDPVVVGIVPGNGVVETGNAGTRLDVDRQFVLADGVDAAVVAVELANRNGDPVPGVAVELNATGSAQFSEDSGPTGADGLFVTGLSNTTVESVTVTARFDQNGDGLAESALINGAPASIQFEDPDQFVFGDGFE